MPACPDLSAALAHGPVLMDGAMGTELTRLGYPLGAAEWITSTLDLAEQVTALHRAYADAGARLHIANTFATSRHVLAELGQESRFEAVNRAAVGICRDAIGEGWVAGSISTYVVGSDRADLPRGDALSRDVHDQATLLVDAGCDMIVIEMLFDVETSIEMIRAASDAGLPISAGLTVTRGPDDEIYLRGEYEGRLVEALRLDTALPAIVAAMPEDGVLTLMHAQFPDTTDGLAILRRHWAGKIGVYPNSGRFVPPDHWDNDVTCTPAEFTAHALHWRGSAFLGGCCGIAPHHIAALNQALEESA